MIKLLPLNQMER